MCRILGPSHILVVTREAISVFAIKGHAPADRPVKASKANDPILCLQLPQLNGYNVQINGHLSAPQYHPQDRPYFYPDPADNLLGFTLEACADRVCAHFVFLVPLSTILTRLEPERPRRRSGWHWRLPRSDSRAYSWNEWGPSGARVVQLTTRRTPVIDVCESRCVIASDEYASGDLFVLDVGAGAGEMEGGVEEVALTTPTPIPFPYFDPSEQENRIYAGDEIDLRPWCRSSGVVRKRARCEMRSTVPCRMRHHKVCEDVRVRGGDVVFVHDDVLVKVGAAVVECPFVIR